MAKRQGTNGQGSRAKNVQSRDNAEESILKYTHRGTMSL
jgi:hypothetical protein